MYKKNRNEIRPMGEGLTHLEEIDLTRLLSKVYREELVCPITTMNMHRAGLSYLDGELEHLRDLDAKAVQRVLVAVLAERRQPPRKEPRLYDDEDGDTQVSKAEDTGLF